MEQIDVTVTVNVDSINPKELQALRESAARLIEGMTGGTAVTHQTQRVADVIAAHDWGNSLTREFAWLIADREDEDTEEVVEWIHENENDPFIWDLVSDMADRISDSARMEG